MNKTVKWILIAVLIIVVIAILILIYQNWQSNKANQPPPDSTGATPPANNIANILGGLFSSDWIKNLFGPKPGTPACQPNNPGFDNNGYYTRKCGGVPGGGGANCDPDNPGKDMNGFLSSQCGG